MNTTAQRGVVHDRTLPPPLPMTAVLQPTGGADCVIFLSLRSNNARNKNLPVWSFLILVHLRLYTLRVWSHLLTINLFSLIDRMV